MQKVATAWLIYQISGSTVWLGIDAFASGIPTVLLLPLGGVIADRIDRRKLLIWTNVLCAILAFIVAGLWAAGLLQIWHIVAISAASGVVQAAMVPASTSLLPALVGETDIPNAIALNSLQFNLSRVVGPAAGGLTLVYLGATWSFSLNAVSFLVLVAALASIKSLPPQELAPEPIWQSIRGGLGFVRQRSDIATLLLLVAVTALLGAPVISMLPALVKIVLQREAAIYSWLLSSFGAGAAVAAMMVAGRGQGGTRPWRVLWALLILGACQCALASNKYVSLALLVVFAAGFCFVGVMIHLGTRILQLTPDSLRGRVSSFQQICFRASQPLGALLAGILAGHLGIRTAFWGFGGTLVVILPLVILHRRSRERI